ncbi:MAG: hypothetical protein U0132_13270 [Gemmatimonadaceae bacterium]
MLTTRMLTTLLMVSCTLAACGGSPGDPTPQPTETLIGPAGGVVRDASGAITLTIPANALATPTKVTVASSSENFVDPTLLRSSQVNVSSGGVQFAIPATLSFSYAADDRPDGTSESELQAVSRNGSSWQTIASATLNTSQHNASAPILGGGTFAIRWVAPATCTRSPQFDFWLGSWNFSAPNSFPGTDIVTKDASGCLVEEDFNDTNHTHGRSVSLLSAVDGKWHQTYVDSPGGRLVFVGDAQPDGSMLLYLSGTERYGWKLLDANTVRYYGERTTNGGQSWSVIFDARYKRP